MFGYQLDWTALINEYIFMFPRVNSRNLIFEEKKLIKQVNSVLRNSKLRFCAPFTFHFLK
jgi:hypothetical protein